MRGWKARYITMDATPSATPRAMTAAGWTPKPLSTAPHDTSDTRYASTATHTRTATPVSSGTSKKRSSIVTRNSMWDSNTKPTVTWLAKDRPRCVCQFRTLCMRREPLPPTREPTYDKEVALGVSREHGEQRLGVAGEEQMVLQQVRLQRDLANGRLQCPPRFVSHHTGKTTQPQPHSSTHVPDRGGGTS